MSNVKSTFTNFKVHTQYSICEGAIKIDDLADYCKKNKIKDVYNLASILKNKFKDSFYLEIQRHNDQDEKKLENIFLSLSNKVSIPIIASQEVFYINKSSQLSKRSSKEQVGKRFSLVSKKLLEDNLTKLL